MSKFIKESEPQESLSREVSDSVKTGSVVELNGLAAGPDAESSAELILVEGRADVIACLKAGVNNVVSVNGTKVPRVVGDLMKSKRVNIVFVDGDRGGDLIVKSLQMAGRVDFVAKAPDGKEVEELVGKEILQALRGKVPVKSRSSRESRPQRSRSGLSVKDKSFVKQVLDEIEGKNLVRVYDSGLKMLGELPLNGLKSVRGLSGVYVIVADAPVNDALLYFAKDNGAQVLVGTKVETRKRSKVKVLTKRTL